MSPDSSDETDSSRGTLNTTGTTDFDNPTESVLELDEVFTALGHPRRRYLVYALANGSTEETLAELAAKIAAWERDKPIADVSDEERDNVHISLYHSHVPKLAGLGILDYHEGEDIVVEALNTEQVQAVLDGAGAELDSRQEAHARRKDANKQG